MSRQPNGFVKGGKVRSTIRMLIPRDKQKEALDILDGVIDQVRFEPRCLSSRIYRGVKEGRAIMLEESWECGRDMLKHLKSDAYRRILFVIEMAEEPPDIRFDFIADSGGVEVIEHARSQG